MKKNYSDEQFRFSNFYMNYRGDRTDRQTDMTKVIIFQPSLKKKLRGDKTPVSGRFDIRQPVKN